MERLQHLRTRIHQLTRNYWYWPRIRTSWMHLSQPGIRHYEAGDYLKTMSNHSSGTMSEVFSKIRKRIDIDVLYHVVPKSREHLLQYQPKPEQLPTRSMQDSYTSAILPLEEDEMSRERYINHVGAVRMGRIMEELDMFAVWLCHRHLKVPELPKDVALPYTFVTLLVDRVDFENIQQLQIDKNIELSGFVSWTGSTSIEATLYVRQLLDDKYLNVTKALFLMVARNATNTGSAPVNKLQPANETENRIWQEAVKRQEQRKIQKSTDITSTPPQEHEQAIMYKILQRSTPRNNFDLNKRVLPKDCHWMGNTKKSSILHPFPENRNAANTIFGGFLMRQAVELSFILSSLYISGRPMLVCVSDITFLEPVPVNSFLEMTAQIVYTKQNYVQILTMARKWDPLTKKQGISNIFNLTYKSDTIVDEVMPGSYTEMLWYIHGRRKLFSALNLQPTYGDNTHKEERKSDEKLENK